MDWVTAHEALWQWVKTATALADGSIRWADQDIRQPANPFVTLRMGELVPLAAVDGVEQDYDEDRDEGAEIGLHVHGERELSVRLQAFVDPVVAGSGVKTGVQLLSACQMALSLSGVRDSLRAAGLSAFDIGTVQNLSELVDDEFEGRAALEVRFYVVDGMSEFTGYIETVEVEDLRTNDEFQITLSEGA